MTKKFLSLFLIIFSFNNIFLKVNAENNEQYFTVTAYYSPLPDQEYYYTGNYEDEIKLNGKGTHGASGLPVFNGMFAGPKKYPFGTKIYLEGIGTGIISDRGSAIVESGERGNEFDRIDVWMGHGDKALRKTLSWGRRTIKGKIIEIPKTKTLVYNKKTYENKFKPNKHYNLEKYRKKQKTIYNISIGLNSNKEDIILLQKKLKELGFYDGEIDGIYNTNLVNKIINFQIQNGIIDSENDEGAGYWGPKTRNSFKNYKKETIKKVEKKEKTEIKKEINNTNIFTKQIEPENNTEKDIKILQKELLKMGLYKGNINGKYESIKDVIIDFQVKNEIIKSENDKGAGYFGPKTRKCMKSKYKELVLKEETRKKSLIYAEKIVDSIGNPKKGENGENIKNLQKVLTTLGYFKSKETAYYGTVTENALIDFQTKNNLKIEKNKENNLEITKETKNKMISELKKKIYEKSIDEEKILVLK